MKCADTRQITMSMNKQKQEENCFLSGITGPTQSTYCTPRHTPCTCKELSSLRCAYAKKILRGSHTVPPYYLSKGPFAEEENCWNVQTLIRD